MARMGKRGAGSCGQEDSSRTAKRGPTGQCERVHAICAAAQCINMQLAFPFIFLRVAACMRREGQGVLESYTTALHVPGDGDCLMFRGA